MVAEAGRRTPSRAAVVVALIVLAGLFGARAVWGDDLELRNSGPVAAVFALAFLGLAVWFLLRPRRNAA